MMRASWLLLTLAACGSPLPAYYDAVALWPVVTGTVPSEADSLMGGEIIEVRGVRLTNTRTVVIGGRNADILDTREDRVVVRTPAMGAGGGPVDVSVATDEGWFTLDDAYTYAAPASRFVQDEVWSASLLRIDCPIETTGEQANGRITTLFWCGAEAGLGYGYGYIGSGSQSGFAGDIQETLPISQLPPMGEVRLVDAGSPAVQALPISFSAHAPDDRIEIVAPRDVAWDLQFIQERIDLVERTYSWAFAIDSQSGPTMILLGEDQCLLSTPQAVTGADGDVLEVATIDPAATDMWLGFSWTELYEDGSTDAVSAVTGTSPIDPVDGGYAARWSGGVLQYDFFSGYYQTLTSGGVEGNSNVVPNIDYTVNVVNSDEVSELGTVRGPPELMLVEPDLMAGDVLIRRREDLTVRWEPIVSDGEPLLMVIEIRVDDYSIAGPNGPEVASRLIAHADPAAGEFTIPAADLERLPDARNRFDPNFDLVGRWAEMSVGMHQLRKVPATNGDLVVDFMHVVNSPVRLR